MLVSSFCASRLSDTTRRMSATELMVFAAPSQQRLRRSSVAAALQPSTQMVAFVASLLEVLLAAPRGRTRRQLEQGRELRAAAAPSQHHQLHRSSSFGRRQCPATMSGRRGLFLWIFSPDSIPPLHKLSVIQNYPYQVLWLSKKSLGHSPEGEVKEYCYWEFFLG